MAYYLICVIPGCMSSCHRYIYVVRLPGLLRLSICEVTAPTGPAPLLHPQILPQADPMLCCRLQRYIDIAQGDGKDICDMDDALFSNKH